MRKIKDKLYDYFVRKNERVRYEYERYVIEHIEEHKRHRIRHIILLLKLNWFYRVLHKDASYIYWDKPMCLAGERQADAKKADNKTSNKKLSEKQAERVPVEKAVDKTNNKKLSEKRIERVPVEEVVDRLEKYDVVSFDLFDTLVFRCVSDPRMVFSIVGNTLKIPGFKKIRIDAEAEARAEDITKEVTLFDIYKKVSEKVEIDIEKAMSLEFEVEKKICVKNPYMYEVYEELIRREKDIIVTSNMYMSETELIEILETCGYTRPNRLFVSCEYKKNKRNGALQEIVSKKIGNEKTVIHVGDNYLLDIEGSRCAGWKTIYYENVNEGVPKNVSIVKGIYTSLINNKKNCGIKIDKYYEYGYFYAGLLIYGYCKWLEKMAKAEEVDKLLFAARDMSIVSKVYKDLFNKCDSEYIRVSRTATIHIVFEGFVQHYLDWHVKRRISSNNSIRTVLEELEMEYLIPEIEKYDLIEDEILTSSNYDKLKKLIELNRGLISSYYEEEKAGARKYFENIVKPNQKVALVDMGWKSSTANCLDYFFNVENKWNINVLSAMIGGEGHQFVEEGIDLGRIKTYVFSDSKNNDLLMRHNKNGNIWRRLYEIVFTSNENSLLSYGLTDEDDVKFNYLRSEIRDASIVDSIHAGIYDFCSDLRKIEDRLNIDLGISERDAYEPLAVAFSNKEYNYELFKDFEVCFIAGNVKENNAELFSEVVRKG